jgi:hypothetical protein
MVVVVIRPVSAPGAAKFLFMQSVIIPILSVNSNNMGKLSNLVL